MIPHGLFHELSDTSLSLLRCSPASELRDQLQGAAATHPRVGDAAQFSLYRGQREGAGSEKPMQEPAPETSPAGRGVNSDFQTPSVISAPLNLQTPPDSDLQAKSALLNTTPGLHQLYRELVVGGLITAEEFWENRMVRLHLLSLFCRKHGNICVRKKLFQGSCKVFF